MRITRLESHLVRLPLARPPRSLPLAAGDRLEHISVLLVDLDTDSGLRGLGFSATLQGGGRALKAVADDDLAPLLAGEDLLDHERLAAQVPRRLQGIGRGGLVPQAYAAVDLALWDLKGKVANLPLYKLLGGAREAAPAFAGTCGWLWLDPDDIVAAARPYLEQGLMGVKLQVGSPDPEADADRVTRVREALGEDAWIGVDANQGYDFGTALAMGYLFEEEMGVDWFEEPLACDDVEGHARLAAKLEVPLAAGGLLHSPAEFRRYVETGAAAVLRPDVTRLGGLTAWLKVAALAELHNRPLAPHLLPEV